MDVGIIRKLLEDIYASKDPNKKELFRATAYRLISGVTEGYGKDFPRLKYNSPDFEMLNKLTYNVGTFAAFKNHDQIKETVKLLKDGEGNLRSKEDFIKEARKLNDTYNKRYLGVEYDQAVTSGRMAKKWQDAKRTQSTYPNLTYIAVMDDRTRPLHRKWHGITLPLEHKFWDSHYPPNDWACRCTVRRSDKPADDKGLNVNDMPSLPKQFNINVGKDGRVYDDSHPYFKTDDYKTVAVYAKNALVRFQTVTYYPKLKDALGGSYKTDIGKITVNNRAIKEALNQPHANAYLKNNLLLKLPEILNDAYYVQSVPPVKQSAHWVAYHYLRVRDFEDMIVVIREDRKGNYFFYSITDKIKS